MFNYKRIILAGFAIFAVFAYLSVPQKETQAQEPLVVADTAVAGVGNNQKGREILALLADLKKISLDESIFSDPIFQSLKDFSVELAPEPKGRQNPFAPIGKDILLAESAGTATTSVRSIPFSPEASAKNNPGSSTESPIVIPVRGI